MRVLFTGSSGSIGSALSVTLRAGWHEVRAGGRDAASLSHTLPGRDAVVHLANVAHARVGQELLRPTNADGTRIAREVAAKAGVRRFQNLSSVNAAVQDHLYTEVKFAAFQALADVPGVENVVTRPPLVYCPGAKANVLTPPASGARKAAASLRRGPQPARPRPCGQPYRCHRSVSASSRRGREDVLRRRRCTGLRTAKIAENGGGLGQPASLYPVQVKLLFATWNCLLSRDGGMPCRV